MNVALRKAKSAIYASKIGILGPLFFLVYTSDLHTAPRMFVDDTSLTRKVSKKST